jgi:hypothetical protein
MRQINAPALRLHHGRNMATAHASLNPQFSLGELCAVEAGVAYPLVRAIAPEVRLADWLDYAERRCREGGLLGLFGADGCLIGLTSYRLGERLRHGRVLALDEFVTFELSQAAPARKFLLEAAEDLARSLGCTGLEVRVGARGMVDGGSSKATGWVSLGLALDSAVFVKGL